MTPACKAFDAKSISHEERNSGLGGNDRLFAETFDVLMMGITGSVASYPGLDYILDLKSCSETQKRETVFV